MTDGSELNDKCVKYLNFDRFRSKYLMLCGKYEDYNSPGCTVLWYPLHKDSVCEQYNTDLGEQASDLIRSNILVEIGACDDLTDIECSQKFEQFIDDVIDRHFDCKSKSFEYLRWNRFKDRYIKLCKKYDRFMFFQVPDDRLVWLPFHNDEVCKFVEVDSRLPEQKRYCNISVDLDVSVALFYKDSRDKAICDEDIRKEWVKFVAEFFGVYHLILNSYQHIKYLATIDPVQKQYRSVDDADAIDDCR